MKTKTPKTFKAPKTPKVKAVKPAANAAAPKVKKPRTTKIKYRILRLSVLSVTLCIVSAKSSPTPLIPFRLSFSQPAETRKFLTR